MDNKKFRELKTDILIIGAGGAGLRAAIEAYDAGAKVTIVSKSLLGKAHTVMAEGGIAASIADVDNEDNWKVHFSDTFVEGAYLGDWKMIEILVKEAPDRVYELEQYGALFDRTPHGKIMQRAFGGHTYKRLCHIGDRTGLEIIRVLEDQVLHRGIQVLDETIITKLAVSSGRIIGAVGLEYMTGDFIAISCKAVILASGGCGRLYKTTSNSLESTGDGLALAYDVGCALVNMEMVQFHPTGMVYPESVKGLLVTEGIRGEGGILLNNKGERFMKRYSPKRMELDARDVVARAIYNEIIKGNGTEHGGVYLDIAHKGAAFIKKKLPAMYDQFKDFADIDITKQKMEVAPTVHYHMGGVKVDAETCATNVKGLYAAGEITGGLHGANRLGGNSLADILIFGRRAGIWSAKYALHLETGNREILKAQLQNEIKRINSYLGSSEETSQYNNGKFRIYELSDALRQIMNEDVSIIRNADGLHNAMKVLETIKNEINNVKISGTTKYNRGLLTRIELENQLIIAECIIRSAIERKESRGAHFRSDFPKKYKKWLKWIICRKKNGRLSLYTSPFKQIPKRFSFIPKEKYS